MLMSRGLLFLLIYCGVLLTNQGCWARSRNNGGGDANNNNKDDNDNDSDEFDVDDYVRRQERRNRRRKEERRQKNKEQEKASSSLIEALESHNKYTAANNPPQTLPTSYSNQTTVVQSSYVVNHNYDHPKPDDIQVGCKELRSKRYISDGFCTSVKPITELVCTGHCLPIRNLPWYAEFIKVWARTKVLEWRCVEDDIRRKRVVLQCENGETRSYRIKVVKSCKCKRYLKPQNQSMLRLNKSKSNRKRRRKTRRQNESPDYLSRNRRSGGGGRGGDL